METADSVQAIFDPGWRAEAPRECEALVVGSAYSVKGTNRYDECPHPAIWRITILEGTNAGHVRHLCGVHSRGIRNEIQRQAERAARWNLTTPPYFKAERL